MAATLADPPSNQMLPSGPLVIPRPPPMQLPPPQLNSVSAPLNGLIAPTSAPSRNHSRLSGPTVISPGVLLVENSVTTPAVVILATTLAFPSKLPSVNQRLPSGPFTMSNGMLPEGTG